MVDGTSVLAAHLIGVVLSSLMYGLALAQAWCYFHSYPTDGRHTKILVALLVALGATQVVLVSASIYQYTIVWASNPSLVAYVTQSFESSMVVSSIMAFVVQLTYAHRIWRFSFGSIPLTCPIILLAFLALGCGTAMVVETAKEPLWDSARENNLPASFFYLASTACDIYIAGSQVYLLHKSRTGIGRLSGVITKLTVLVVNVGLLTSFDATIFLILFLVCPSNGIFLVPYILISHCYLNSFLSILNSRRLLRELIDDSNCACPHIVTCVSETATPQV